VSKGYTYILECSDGSYYTGSTKNLERRLWEHQNSRGANYTKKRLPVKLVYFEEYSRIDEAFYREKQVQGWSRKKKRALIEGHSEYLPLLSKNYTQFGEACSSLSTVSSTIPVSSTSSETGEKNKIIEPIKRNKVVELVETTGNNKTTKKVNANE